MRAILSLNPGLILREVVKARISTILTGIRWKVPTVDRNLIFRFSYKKNIDP